MVVKGNLKGIFNWDGYYYGFKQLKRGNKYYKSKNARFDDTCGGTEECSREEFHQAACEYADVFGKDAFC